MSSCDVISLCSRSVASEKKVEAELKKLDPKTKNAGSSYESAIARSRISR